jgi:hypothetical protein
MTRRETAHVGGSKPVIVLIYGSWMTPRIWENWVAHYESFGYQLFARLFIAGGEDHIMPPSVNKANYRLQCKERLGDGIHGVAGRCHYTSGQEGWEPLAGYALSWATHQVQRLAAPKHKLASAPAVGFGPAIWARTDGAKGGAAFPSHPG